MKLSKSILFASAAVAVGIAGASATARTQDSGTRYNADILVIEDFIGQIEIRTGNSSQIDVRIENAGGIVDNPTLENAGGRVLVNGGQSMRRLNCNSRDGRMRIGRSRLNMHPIEDYPTLVVTAPADMALTIRDSAFKAEAGDLGELDLAVNSCGRFEAGSVARDASIGVHGSGDVILANVGGDAEVDINGSGDVSLEMVSGAASVDISGSGDVQTEDVQGDATVSINGSGDVEFGAVAGLSVRVSGSGDVEAQSMNGPFQATISGSGDVGVRSGRAQPFDVSIHGSGDIRFGGTAVDVTVREQGGGDVEIGDIEGSIDWRRNGRTVMRVGNAN